MPEFQHLVEALQHWSETQGDGPAFIFRHGTHGRHVLTWKQLYTLSGRLAAILRQRALSRGQLVVNTLTNSPERVVSELAILMSGAASVNGQCLLADGSDLLRTLRVSRAAAILVDPDVTDSPWNVLKRYVTVGDDDSVTSESLPDLKKVFLVRRVEGKGKGDFLGRLETLSDWFQADDVTPDDKMSVFTTSGTTGFSKLVVYTHKEYLQNMKGMADYLVPSGEKCFSLAPLGWIGGYVGHGFFNGATRVLLDVRAGGTPDDMPGFIWRSLLEEGCRTGYVAPLFLPRLAEMFRAMQLENKAKSFPVQASEGGSKTQEKETQKATTVHSSWANEKINLNGKNTKTQENQNGVSTPQREDTSSTQDTKRNKSANNDVTADQTNGDVAHSTSPPAKPLTLAMLGGLPVTRAMVRSALAISDSVMVLYGATDFGLVSEHVVRDWTDYVDHDTGPPLNKVQVKIVSQQDEHTQLPADQLGHILVRKPVAPDGYLNDPEATAAMLTSDGFIRTGDVGRLDQRGHLIVEGRGSDAIMRGLYIFYPAWLERRICACPGVRDVIIVGVPDPDVNEELCACVVLESDDLTMTEVREFVERDIVSKEDDPLSPRPRYYLRFQSFPLTNTGKVGRKAVKKQAAQMLGLSSTM